MESIRILEPWVACVHVAAYSAYSTHITADDGQYAPNINSPLRLSTNVPKYFPLALKPPLSLCRW